MIDRVPRLELERIEGFFFLAAMLLAIVLEAACVYWLRMPTVPRLRSGEPPTLVVEWTGNTLPHYWLLGALGVMLYRIAVMVLPPKAWDQSDSQRNRSAFMRLWSWTVVVGSAQILALYFDQISIGVR